MNGPDSTTSVETGAVLAGLLAGAALTSLLLAHYADRIGRRRSYAALLIAMGAAGTAFALTGSLPVLVLAALTGTISTDVIESGPFTSLEQAMLPHASGSKNAASVFGTYNAIAALAGSLGALAAGGPTLLDTGSARWLLAYPGAGGLALVAAVGLSAVVEAPAPSAARPRGVLQSRPIVRRLAALFSLDAFGGGFVVQTFVAYWFTRKFGTPADVLGLVFFCAGILQAGSFYAAVRIARRAGLLNTMVFSHLPSNVLLAAIAFAPTEATAFALLLARFALSQMDVPTRQAYVVALVEPAERTAAAAYTNTARYVTRPLAPLLAGPLAHVALGAPFVAAGAVKAAYDVGLWRMFRRVALR